MFIYRMFKFQNFLIFFSKVTLALDAGDLWTGGMETTVTTLRWAIIYLIRNPDVQEHLHDEIDQVIIRYYCIF